MSITTEILRLQGAKSALKTAIEGKGVAVPSSAKIDGYSALVDAIEQGGGEGVWITDNGNPDFTGSGGFQPEMLIKKLIIPDGYTSIADGLFRNISGLEEVVMPDSITVIGGNSSTAAGAFRGCTTLRNINLSSNLQQIGRYTFYGCTSLLRLALPTTITAIYAYAFQLCMAAIDGINLPDCTTLNTYAFAGCDNLKGDIVLPKLTVLGGLAFNQCGIERIMDLGSITVISRLTGSGYGVKIGTFSGCTSLREVHLPSTLAELKGSTFYGCTSLTDVYVEAATPPDLENVNAFAQCPLEHIYVPAESVAAYKVATNWSSFETIINAIPTT